MNVPGKLKKTDPSDVKQLISDVQINILCCRYWILNYWEGQNLSAPFWRLYYNRLSGGEIKFNDQTYDVGSDKLILIPPNTRYSTKFKGNTNGVTRDIIEGRRLEKNDTIADIKNQDAIDHLFIHFNLNMQFRLINTGIYLYDITDDLNQIILKIQEDVIADNRLISFSTTLLINLLLFRVLYSLPMGFWGKSISDKRVLKAMDYIKNFCHLKITNELLAENSNMAINSFARLFKEKSGLSIQQYVLKVRIENACDLMHHSSYSIDDIAVKCGFFDRHHFSTAFKQQLNITPAYYMKNHTMTQS
ncbi:MAG: helix-turn-helix transcriptional regulator [Marinilabiliaceae bacterium]|nr:helix-turn-helix transcriptional regulator [Marinilabiliaceae bacterium]